MRVLLASWSQASEDLVGLACGLGDVVAVVLPADSTSATLAAQLEATVAQYECQAVVLPSGRASAEVAAVLAVRMDAGLVVDAATATLVDGEIHATKRELGGTWEVTCVVAHPAVVLAQPVPHDGKVAAPSPGELAPASGECRDVTRGETSAVVSDGVALADASIAVVAGRGLNGDLGPVRELAEALDGAVGATRDIVEEDWIGPEAMVGQTGTMIAPRLYIGAGLSGAPHHVLGMRGAEVIVAINTDPDAPIMELADLAIVGDAAQVLGEAAELVRARRGR